MSVNCVPPGRTSPYQKGAGASAKVASLKLVPRQAVMSGIDASAVPRRKRQVEFKGNNSAAWTAKVQKSNPRAMERVNMRD